MFSGWSEVVLVDEVMLTRSDIEGRAGDVSFELILCLFLLRWVLNVHTCTHTCMYA